MQQKYRCHTYDVCVNMPGWAVALTCCMSHSISIGKWHISTPQGAITPEPILTKLGMVDYIRDPTQHDNFGGGSATLVVPANV